MATNLLIAIKNIVNNPTKNITPHNTYSNRINSKGETLELYIKDAFCNTLTIADLNKKNEIFSKEFSYIGNQNNPPDIMIRGGDAVEIKKIEGTTSGIALNSSYPKDRLYADSPMITEECRRCEDWTEKDILYSIGVVKNDTLKSLWFIYGDCYAAKKDIYEKIKAKISSGLQELTDIELAKTNELGRVNRVDPLGITYLRIHGMWHIENPDKVFSYILPKKSDFSVNALILNEKYNSFPGEDRKALENIKNDNFIITNVRIKSPNNPAKMLGAKLISFNK